ncbi:tryptophan halogenase family protein [Roseateles saccharophilus]|uniref:Tryptophan halogenase n=1 Tax=Roseateles saccharophilus TaxID=304 RepID=A0A4R3UKF5_ROSSA|nr:tryptophan halogenase family protein [Roseateles saccharophilus]MDG0833939.1 tryptophan 7-halogenase [Roseateles saccharophilus]TCU91117.1 tryptophan halogenase [Roseateles saccharophilus]
MTAPKHIAIIGGGTAGWMTANLLRHRWARLGIDVTLIESAEIGTVGVGEGSTPYLRRFFATLGLAERDWMPACDATYKCGIRFPGWSRVAGYESYVHPFFNEADRELGNQFFTNACLRRRGQAADANPQDFFLAAELARQRRAPLYAGEGPGTDYAYHFDAGRLGAFLRGHALGLGVRHIVDTVARVERHEGGDIAAVQLKGGTRIAAELFVDCSGFKGLLINETLGQAFLPYRDNLFNDRAIAIPTALVEGEDLPSETVSTALRHGWAWQIPLTTRYGNGYVYSSDFIGDDEAERELRAHLGAAAEGASARRLRMRVGRADKHWSRNCVAVGLSQGFIEPLEATALMLIQFSVEGFIDALEGNGFEPGRRDAYNRRVNEMFEGVRDYVVAHYQLNTRSDTDYWRANRANRHISDRLASLLDVWDGGGDFEAELERHGSALMYLRPSWYALLAGMGRFPAELRPAPQSVTASQARARLHQMARAFSSHRSQLMGG